MLFRSFPGPVTRVKPMIRNPLRTLIALLLLGCIPPAKSVADALADSTRPEFYGTPPPSLAGRFHRLAFLPMPDWYIPSSRWDSIRTAIEPLLVEEFRSAGFEVVDRDKGVAICMRLADSLGGNFDRRKGRVDPEREAVLRIQTVLTLANEYQPDGLIVWGLTTIQEDCGLFVYIEDSGGSSVYRNEIAAPACVPPEELPRFRKDYAARLKAVLEPFCESVKPVPGPPTGANRR